MGLDIKELLEPIVVSEASDLHLKAGSPPGLRLHGKLQPMEGFDKLSPDEVRTLVNQLLSDEDREAYDREKELDFSMGIPGMARFRVNIFRQRGTCAAVMRKIPVAIPKIEDLGFPDLIRDLCRKPRGLVLITGPTGSGKSTTLASMIDYINEIEQGHILTLEDPIEFIHEDKRCYVNQREIGTDSKSFATALRSALREDPDVILVGEMRDLETIGLAITAAETGHLVFGTLHTTSAMQTVDRIVDVFPHEAQQQIRTQLSNTLQGVISQVLLPKVGGGLACAQEIMVGTDGVRALIREGKTAQLLNMIQTGGAQGMQTLESALERLVTSGDITADTALSKTNNPAVLRQSLAKSGVKVAADGAGERRKPSTQQIAERFAEAAGVGAGAKQGPVDDFEQFRKRRRGG